MSNRKKVMGIILIFILIICGVVSYKAIENKMDANRKTTFQKCISIGNALEAPKNISWDVTMRADYFDIIKNAGFDSVRLPVRFSDYANKDTYILDETFMKKIDHYIDYALNDDLTLILDFHHFTQIMKEPEQYKEMFLSIWNQLSDRYKNYSDKLIFELLNEPKDNLRGDLWNQYLKEGVDVIRTHDKGRKIIVGPDSYNSVERLYDLVIPNDRNLILTFHYYEPNTFTFQGNQYHEGFEHLKNIKWNGTEQEMETLNNKFDIAKKYSKENNIPVFLGEFGANKKASEPYRGKWIGAVRHEAEKYNFSWSYWELCSEFGIYDLKTNTWDNNLKQLIP